MQKYSVNQQLMDSLYQGYPKGFLPKDILVRDLK